MVAKTNPLNETQFKRLRGSIDWSERQFEYPRRKRRQAVKQFVGYHYSEGGASKRVPTPFLKMAVNIYVRLLAARAPRVLMTTKRPDLKWVAANMELALNEIPREIKLQNTLRRAVTEALFSPFGMVKYGLHTVGKVLGHDYGASFVDLVTLDDLFLDMAAHHMDEIQYIGNSYWLDYKEVMESEWFKKKKLHGLEPDEYTVQNPAGEERAESISVGESAELFKKKICA